MADEIPELPPTIAQLPFFASGRFPKPDLLGRCEGDRIVKTSGRELIERVREIGIGLQSLGLAPGDRVVLLAESRPEWLIADFAVLASGGVTVPVYPTLAADQIRFITRDSGASIAIVSTDVQLEKLLSVASDLPDLRTVVIMQPGAGRQTNGAGTPPMHTIDQVAELGHKALRDGWGVAREFHERAKRVRPSDLATIVYTSGTTGEPKGVMLTHANLLANVSAVVELFHVDEDDVALSFLPLCHGFERLVAYVYVSRGVTTVFAEALETVAANIAMVRPTLMTGVPRVYEKLHARIMAAGSQGSAIERAVFKWACGVADARGRAQARESAPSPWLRLKTRLADRLVFAKIRAKLGGRFRFAVSGSAPLGDTLGRFFFGIGLPLIEGYGLTETSPVLTAVPVNAIRFGTVGPPLSNVEIKIADDGEILARGPNIMPGYWHRPDDTAAVLKDGWFYTGDIGQLDERGYLRITDRKKELICTSGGKKIAPQPIETELRRHPLIAEAVLLGESRHFPTALIVPEFGALATQLGVARPAGEAATAALLERPDVRALYDAAVAEVNATHAQFERIKKFHLLRRELTLEAGELTPTLKVKRRVIDARYKAEIEAMYRD